MDKDSQPLKSLGQHWLNDKSILKQIIETAHIGQDDVVLEVGPGLGSLTDLLINEAGKVIAVELDQTLIANLESRFLNTDKLEIVNQDIRRFDLTKLPVGYKVVANIPYYLTSYLIRLLSETANPPKQAVILIQKEVADRLAAVPGEMSTLSLTAQVFWEINLGTVVPPFLFTPPPKVDSQVVSLSRLAKPLVGPALQKDFFWLVKVAFSQKRKTLLNSLSAGLRVEKDSVRLLLESAHIKPESRPQELRIDDWIMLAKSLPKFANK